MKPSVRFWLPSREVREAPVTPSDAQLPLSEWLARHHAPLNTRCGGRGLCRGCLVEQPGNAVSARACQIKMAQLMAGAPEIRIPEASLYDTTLTGVSAFEILAEPPAPLRRAGLGVAVDIGTTTLAGALWDLDTGECLALTSRANPQRIYGDNVSARTGYAMQEPEGAARLHQRLCDLGLKPLLADLLRKADRDSQPVEVILAGNAIMMHTVAGCALDGFGSFPFRPEFLNSRSLSPAVFGLCPGTAVTLLPSAGPFVGADVTAGALAAGMSGIDGTALLIDFGTNGEILLKHQGRYWATATAAGPAFEGGRLTCGQTASDCAISGLNIQDGAWTWTLCGGSPEQPPTGLSGAAYISFLAKALAEGLITAMGRLDPAHPLASERTVDGDVLRCVELTPQIFITEGDIGELMQAKAAIAAGTVTLLELAGVDANGIDQLFLAGGFGYYLDHRDAGTIGLIPPIHPSRVQAIGNSSLAGASLVLLTQNVPALESATAEWQCIELNAQASFEDHYLDALQLGSECFTGTD
ncbi:MAG: ASKHA domain-containing protein [Opitutales bacterium]